MTRKRGWPMGQMWHKGLWRQWDKISPQERREYERHYENTATATGLRKLTRTRLGKMETV